MNYEMIGIIVIIVLLVALCSIVRNGFDSLLEDDDEKD